MPAKKKNLHKRAGEKKQIENAANHFLNLIWHFLFYLRAVSIKDETTKCKLFEKKFHFRCPRASSLRFMESGDAAFKFCRLLLGRKLNVL